MLDLRLVSTSEKKRNTHQGGLIHAISRETEIGGDQVEG